jgi:hypothetical protein
MTAAFKSPIPSLRNFDGARSDMRTLAAFLKPIRERLRELSGQPGQEKNERTLRMIDRMQAKRVVIDSLSGFELALTPSHSKTSANHSTAWLPC